MDYRGPPSTVLLRLPQLQYFSCFAEREEICGMGAALLHLQQLNTLRLMWYAEGLGALQESALGKRFCVSDS
jgi:hypothetical protein